MFYPLSNKFIEIKVELIITTNQVNVQKKINKISFKF